MTITKVDYQGWLTITMVDLSGFIYNTLYQPSGKNLDCLNSSLGVNWWKFSFSGLFGALENMEVFSSIFLWQFPCCCLLLCLYWDISWPALLNKSSSSMLKHQQCDSSRGIIIRHSLTPYLYNFLGFAALYDSQKLGFFPGNLNFHKKSWGVDSPEKEAWEWKISNKMDWGQCSQFTDLFCLYARTLGN